MTSPAALLHALASADHSPLPAEVAAVLADAARQVLEGEADSLDQALGLRPSPGCRRPSTVAALGRRDELLREAAERFFPGRPVADQGRELATALQRYAAGLRASEAVGLKLADIDSGRMVIRVEPYTTIGDVTRQRAVIRGWAELAFPVAAKLSTLYCLHRRRGQMLACALILAGGRGERLYPYTATLPKPLMPIGDKPILEHIIRRLQQFGVREIVLAVNHLAPLVETYFGDGKQFGCRISYIREETPVGTAGPIAFLPEFNDSLLVMNADVICDIDYAAVILAHRRTRATITVASRIVSTVIASGVLETDARGHVVGYREKPSYDHRICMGIYVIEPRVRTMIQPGRQLDMPELISQLIAAGETVVAYNHTGEWIDIGRPEDYARAQAEFSSFAGTSRRPISEPTVVAAK